MPGPCPGGGTATRTASGSARSCSSRRPVAAVVPYFERFLAAFPDAGRPGRGRRAGGAQAVGGPGLLPPGPRPAPRPPGCWSRSTAADCRTTRPSGRSCRASAGTSSAPSCRRRSTAGCRSSRPTPCASCAGCSARPGDPRAAAGQAWLWQTAEAVLPRTHVGDFNQALMELGRWSARPQAPDCPNCPLKAECLARREGFQEHLPRKPARSATVEVREVCVVARHGGRVLLARRPAGGRWANMWEFPRAVLEPRPDPRGGREEVDRLRSG